jgi:hypothetical protein
VQLSIRVLFLLVSFAVITYGQLALASKSRMVALGQDSEEGSYYLVDGRNFFKNPAAIILMKSFVITEWGDASNGIADTNSTPHAEGGFFSSDGDGFNYGLYLGSEVGSYNQEKSNSNASLMLQDNRLDIFLGGDAGFGWGARVHFAQGQDEQSAGNFERSHSSLGVGLGLLYGDLESYVNLDTKNESQGATNKEDSWKGDLGLKAGAVYHLTAASLYVQYYDFSYQYASVGSATQESSFTEIIAGVGKVVDLNREARLMFDLSYYQRSDKASAGNGSQVRVPLNLAFEADLKEWLSVRGSVKQNIYGFTKDSAQRSMSYANSTSVMAGVTISLDQLKIDGLLGMVGSSGTTAQTGMLSGDTLLSRISLSYLF